MRRAERLFHIIQVLRRSTLPVTGAAIAAELEVSTRTIYRDIADLMARRVPITGEAGFAYLLAAKYDMPPLMLTPAELEAIVLGAQWVAGRGDPMLSPAARDVLAKIATAVPVHLRPFIEEPSMATEPRLDHASGQSGSGVCLGSFVGEHPRSSCSTRNAASASVARSRVRGSGAEMPTRVQPGAVAIRSARWSRVGGVPTNRRS